MTQQGVGIMGFVLLIGLMFSGCSTTPKQHNTDDDAWPSDLAHDAPDRREVTVVIALSSVLPGGVVGHSGIAVDRQYWDFGPQRVAKHQRLKAFNSPAGPWWDDPGQQWQADRTLAEVLDDLPGKVHPTGSLIAVVRVEVTDAQAESITAFWEDTYDRMRGGEDRYRLRGRQCANMVGWSLAEALHGDDAIGHRLPRGMRLMTPTRLYETLRDDLRHTAGPRIGQPADVSLWQLDPDGIRPWQRPVVWDTLGVPELPRTRLAFERVRYMPSGLIHK